MKIQLQSLRVVNCGPLDNVCIQFNTKSDSPVTVLAGANGSGKTTVLNCITALFKLLDADTFREPAKLMSESLFHPYEDLSLATWLERHLPEILSRCEYAQMNLLVDNESFALFYGVLPDQTHLPENHYGIAVGSKRHRKVHIKGELTRRITNLIGLQSTRRVDELYGPDTELETEQKLPPLPSIIYFPHFRSLLPFSGQQIEREEIRYEWLFKFQTVSTFAGSLDSYLIWLDYSEPELFKLVIEFLDGLNLDGKHFGIRRKELRAIVTTKDGQTHGVAELSSGEQNILIMLLELRRRLLPGSIVLIDEIENSLHAAYQHLLGQGLKRMQEEIPFQLIVSTHSSEFVDIFGTSSVRILTEF